MNDKKSITLSRYLIDIRILSTVFPLRVMFLVGPVRWRFGNDSSEVFFQPLCSSRVTVGHDRGRVKTKSQGPVEGGWRNHPENKRWFR